MSDKGKWEELAKRLAARTRELHEKHKTRPKLAVVKADAPAATQMHDLERESHCRMIRHLRRRWGMPMQILIDQACFGLPGIEQLSDEELIALHKDLERAQDCMRDGVSFEDAGLIRSRYG